MLGCGQVFVGSSNRYFHLYYSLWYVGQELRQGVGSVGMKGLVDPKTRHPGHGLIERLIAYDSGSTKGSPDVVG